MAQRIVWILGAGSANHSEHPCFPSCFARAARPCATEVGNVLADRRVATSAAIPLAIRVVHCSQSVTRGEVGGVGVPGGGGVPNAQRSSTRVWRDVTASLRATTREKLRSHHASAAGPRRERPPRPPISPAQAASSARTRSEPETASAASPTMGGAPTALPADREGLRALPIINQVSRPPIGGPKPCSEPEDGWGPDGFAGGAGRAASPSR